MFTLIKNAPAGLVAIDATGKITSDDYKDVFEPTVDAAVAEHGKARVLMRFGPEFDGYTAHAALEDTMVGMKHWSHFERLAIVTDVEWIAHGVHLFAPVIPAKVRVFPIGSLDEALAWASA